VALSGVLGEAGFTPESLNAKICLDAKLA